VIGALQPGNPQYPATEKEALGRKGAVYRAMGSGSKDQEAEHDKCDCNPKLGDLPHGHSCPSAALNGSYLRTVRTRSDQWNRHIFR